MSQLIEVPLDRLDSGENIRSAGVGDLDEMVASVSAVGIVTPVTVYQPDGSSRWMLVAGHRRVEAARRAGFDTVPALQLDAALSADDRLAVALVENLLREDIDPIDEAHSYMRLREHGWTVAEIAGRVGRDGAHISRRCALLELSAPLIDKVRRGNIETRHADTLVQLARGGATPKQLERHSTEPPLQAERAFKRQQAETGRRQREAELADAGVTVVTADEFPLFPGTRTQRHRLRRAQQRTMSCSHRRGRPRAGQPDGQHLVRLHQSGGAQQHPQTAQSRRNNETGGRRTEAFHTEPPWRPAETKRSAQRRVRRFRSAAQGCGRRHRGGRRCAADGLLSHGETA